MTKSPLGSACGHIPYWDHSRVWYMAPIYGSFLQGGGYKREAYLRQLGEPEML